MTIQILGTGCTKCNLLEKMAREAVFSLGQNIGIEKITDIDQIQDMGVMVTPALAVDGVVKSTGRVLTKDQIMAILQGAS